MMRRFGGAVVLLVVCAACRSIKPAQETASAPADAGAAVDTRWLDVRSVQVEPMGSGRRLTMELTQAPQGVHEVALATPPRLMIDLEGPRPTDPGTIRTFAVSDETLAQVRVGSRAGQLRAVLDFSRDPGAHTVRTEGSKLIVELTDAPPAAPEAQAAAPAPPEIGRASCRERGALR